MCYGRVYPPPPSRTLLSISPRGNNFFLFFSFFICIRKSFHFSQTNLAYNILLKSIRFLMKAFFIFRVNLHPRNPQKFKIKSAKFVYVIQRSSQRHSLDISIKYSFVPQTDPPYQLDKSVPDIDFSEPQKVVFYRLY